VKKILVACLGNIFYGDDAFGIEVFKELTKQTLPESVKVKDFGIRGLDLAYEIAGNYALVILVDTIKVGARAGSVFVLEPKRLEKSEFLTHDLTPNKALQFAGNFENRPEKILLIGCEPVNLEFNSEMSGPVKNAVGKAAAKILEIIANENI
jgi:hydrogenase maturation protease